MNRTTTSYTRGRIAAGEYEVVTQPKSLPSVAHPPIIFAHGYTDGQPAAGAMDGSAYARIFAKLTRLDAVAIAADLGGNSWGNDAAADRVEAARAFAVTRGAVDDRAIVVGVSMGFLTCYAYARQYPERIRAVYGIIPASSVLDIRDNARANVASMNAAYGIAPGDALPARYDPTQTPDPFFGISGKLYYGGADATVIPATVTNLASFLGWEADEFDTDHAHASNEQLAAFPHADLAARVLALF